MSTCGTERRASRALLAMALLPALLLAAPARADDESEDRDVDLEARAEATLGTRFYVIEGPYDNDNLGGFWDQYRQTRKKNLDPPFFIDLFHSDIGLARDDDTYLIRLESFSPNFNNERVDVDGQWRGLDFDFGYRRYRSEDVRLFPRGTLQDDQNPPSNDFLYPYGTHYTPDADENEFRNANRRFFLKRTSLAGELRFRPEGFGFGLPVLSQASLRSGYEWRKGWRQDRFLLHTTELAAANRRFRGNRRRIDHEVGSVGGGLVLNPGGDFVADLDVSFESFRVKNDTVVFADIAASDTEGAIPAPSGNTALRAFNYVPNTDRVSGAMRLNGSVGPVKIQGSAFVTHLQQTNRSPLQRALGRNKQELTTWSTHAGFDLPLAERVGLAGFAKYSQRDNDLGGSDFESAGRWIGPILRRRSELEAEVELSAALRAGALVATGYRFDHVDRNFRYPSPPVAIERPLSLVEDDSLKHTLYVRGRARLLRRAQVSGELGWEYAPQRDFPRDPTYTVYFDGRGSYTLPEPWPVTLTLFGGVRDGKGNGRVLTGASTQARKDLDRLRWNYGATVTAMPSARTTVAVSFVEHRDEQDMDYLRTDFPRTAGTTFTNFIANPERPHYKSDVKSLAVSGTHRLSDAIELRAFSNVNWVRAWYSDSSNTAFVLESASEVRSVILSTGGGLGWKATEGLRFDLGYRFDNYIDRKEGDAPLSLDDRRHAFTLAVTIDLGLVRGAVRAATN